MCEHALYQQSPREVQGGDFVPVSRIPREETQRRAAETAAGLQRNGTAPSYSGVGQQKRPSKAHRISAGRCCEERPPSSPLPLPPPPPLLHRECNPHWAVTLPSEGEKRKTGREFSGGGGGRPPGLHVAAPAAASPPAQSCPNTE